MDSTIYKPSIYKGNGIYNNGAGGGGGGLPDDYIELLYLRNKSNAWLKIEKSFVGWGVELVFALNGYSSSSEENEFFSHRGDSNDIMSLFSDKTFTVNNHTYTTPYSLSSLNNYEQVSINLTQNNTTTISGHIQYGSTSIDVSRPSNGYTNGTYITLFRGSDNPFGKSKRLDLYKVKIFDKENVMQLDLVPAKRSLDGYLGFFDKLTNTFYACEGQPNLEAGPEV